MADTPKYKLLEGGRRQNIATGEISMNPNELVKYRKSQANQTSVANNAEAGRTTGTYSTAPTRLTSSDLMPERELSMPTVPPATEGAGLISEIQASSDQFTQAQQLRAEQAKQPYQDLRDLFASELAGQEGEVARTASAYAERGGVNDIQKELDDINNTIRAKTQALNRRVEKIQTTAGLTKGQVDQRVAEVERQATRELADLYIIQQGVQGRYDSAKTIADRAVQAELEGQRNRLQTLQFLYNDYKEDFTREEQRAFELAQGDRERKLAKEENDRKAIYNLAIEAKKNGASSGVMQSILNSQTPEAALTVGGNYLVKPTAASAPKLQNFGTSDNPVWRQYNYKTGTWETVSGLGTSGLSPQQVTEIDNAISESQVALDVIDNILANKRGIGAITGQVQAPGISGFFQGGKAGGKGAFDSGLTRYVPVVGNIQGAIQSRNDRDNVLTDLSYIYNTEGFQEFIGLKQSGLTFGNLTGGERQAIFAAAGRLNSAIELEKTPGGDVSGKVIGYRGTDDKLIEDLQLVAKGLKEYQDEKNAQLTLGQDDKLEIINTP